MSKAIVYCLNNRFFNQQRVLLGNSVLSIFVHDSYLSGNGTAEFSFPFRLIVVSFFFFVHNACLFVERWYSITYVARCSRTLIFFRWFLNVKNNRRISTENLADRAQIAETVVKPGTIQNYFDARSQQVNSQQTY